MVAWYRMCQYPRHPQTYPVTRRTIWPGPTMKTLICNCNRTMPLDPAALGRALGTDGPHPVHTVLCRREAGNRHTVGGARDVVHAYAIAELHRIRITAMLAANSHFKIRPC